MSKFICVVRISLLLWLNGLTWSVHKLVYLAIHRSTDTWLLPPLAPVSRAVQGLVFTSFRDLFKSGTHSNSAFIYLFFSGSAVCFSTASVPFPICISRTQVSTRIPNNRSVFPSTTPFSRALSPTAFAHTRQGGLKHFNACATASVSGRLTKRVMEPPLLTPDTNCGKWTVKGFGFDVDHL